MPITGVVRLTILTEAVRARALASPAAAGIVSMVAASAVLTSMHALVRYVSADMHPFEVAFFRNVFGFGVLLPWLFRTGLVALSTRRFPLHLTRSVLNGASMLCWFTALSMIPLADATALSLTSPLFATMGAILVLGEPIRLGRWVALATGIAGTLVILRPGFEEVSLGALLVVGSSVFVCASKLIAKSLTRTDGTASIVAYLSLLMIPVTGIPAAFVWQTPSAMQLLLLLGIGGLGSLGHLCVVNAYRMADVGLVEPVIFCRLIWAALLGFVVFAEVPEASVWLGGALIVGATTYVTRREAKRRPAP